MGRIHIRKHIPETTRWWGFNRGRTYFDNHHYINIGFGKYFLVYRDRPLPKGVPYRFFDWYR